MVDVAQLVEPRIVIPAVAGSSPVVHPTFEHESCPNRPDSCFTKWVVMP